MKFLFDFWAYTYEKSRKRDRKCQKFTSEMMSEIFRILICQRQHRKNEEMFLMLFLQNNLNDLKFSISFQLRGGGVSIETLWDIKNGTSRLTIGSLKIDDSGYYSCKSNGFESERVHLHVVEHLKRKFQYKI